MLTRLFGRKPEREPPPPPPSTGGRLVYAVGDVHGRLDLLRQLVHAIIIDAGAARVREKPLLVFLGDYVDRGPESREVVDVLLELQARPEIEVALLKGNHEHALLQFLEDSGVGPAWLDFGAGATLASYGVQPPASRTDLEAWAEARDLFAAVLPERHRRFYEELELVRVVGDYAFVHAGVRPGVPLADQVEQDLLWIRQEFLNDRGPFEKVIVHGHTPRETAELLPHRLGLDTGAYATGVLTAVRLCGEEQRLIQTGAQREAAA